MNLQSLPLAQVWDFHRLGFSDFYALHVNLYRGATLVLKYKLGILILGGAMCLLSACISFLQIWLAVFWRDLLKFGIFSLMLSISVKKWCICSGTHQFLMCMLRECIQSWHIRSGYASVLTHLLCIFYMVLFKFYTCTHCMRLFLTQCTHQFLTCMLRARIRSWRIFLVHVSFHYTYAEVILNEHLKNGKTDAHAEHLH